jgi:hypothetical protein
MPDNTAADGGDDPGPIETGPVANVVNHDPRPFETGGVPNVRGNDPGPIDVDVAKGSARRSANPTASHGNHFGDIAGHSDDDH